MAELEPAPKPKASSAPPPSNMHLEGTATHLETDKLELLLSLQIKEPDILLLRKLLSMTFFTERRFVSFICCSQVCFVALTQVIFQVLEVLERS